MSFSLEPLFKSCSLEADGHLVWQRVPVAVSCLVFIVLARFKTSAEIKLVLFSVLVVLACPEKLASIANAVSVERDWVSTTVFSSKRQYIRKMGQKLI